MSRPSDLSSSTDDIGKDVRGRPWIRIVYQSIDFLICRVINSESFLDQTFPDVIRQVFVSWTFALFCNMVSQSVGEVFRGVGGVDEHVWEPVVDGVRVVEFCDC